MTARTGEAIEVTVNGAPRAVPAGTTVAGLLALLGVRAETVAVERNGAVVRRRDHSEVRLEAGDAIEVVTFVGGG
jgi:sulfur carrier protein